MYRFTLLVAAACTVFLSNHQGAVLFVLFSFTWLLSDEVIFIKRWFAAQGSVGYFGFVGLRSVK